MYNCLTPVYTVDCGGKLQWKEQVTVTFPPCGEDALSGLRPFIYHGQLGSQLFISPLVYVALLGGGVSTIFFPWSS